MRLIGYCTKCRTIKYVWVRQIRPRGVQVGVCLDCEDRSQNVVALHPAVGIESKATREKKEESDVDE